MSKIFEYKMNRPYGGEPVVLTVTDGAISATFMPPISSNEQLALKGLETLATAMKKETIIPYQGAPQAGQPTIQILTPERDPALGMVVAQILQAQGVTEPGSAQAYAAAADKFEHPPVQQALAIPKVQEIDQLAKIRQAMMGMVTPAKAQAPSSVPQVAELAITPDGHARG